MACQAPRLGRWPQFSSQTISLISLVKRKRPFTCQKNFSKSEIAKIRNKKKQKYFLNAIAYNSISRSIVSLSAKKNNYQYEKFRLNCRLDAVLFNPLYISLPIRYFVRFCSHVLFIFFVSKMYILCKYILGGLWLLQLHFRIWGYPSWCPSITSVDL